MFWRGRRFDAKICRQTSKTGTASIAKGGCLISPPGKVVPAFPREPWEGTAWMQLWREPRRAGIGHPGGQELAGSADARFILPREPRSPIAGVGTGQSGCWPVAWCKMLGEEARRPQTEERPEREDRGSAEEQPELPTEGPRPEPRPECRGSARLAFWSRSIQSSRDRHQCVKPFAAGAATSETGCPTRVNCVAVAYSKLTPRSNKSCRPPLRRTNHRLS